MIIFLIFNFVFNADKVAIVAESESNDKDDRITDKVGAPAQIIGINDD